jgi:hypothetical protein
MKNHGRTDLSSLNAEGTDKKKPKIILRRGGKKDGKAMDFTATAQTEDTALATGEVMVETTVQAIVTTEDTGAVVAVPEVNDHTPAPPALPPIPGFHLEGVSRNQQYWIRTMLVLCDCCVKRTPEAVFDVLARNFNDVGGLCWWLWRIGQAVLVPRTKGKDLVDAFRVVAHALHQQLRTEIGKPIPRW